ncbi:sce7726 family protein [Neobacillus sp. SCS-31]|uniref:sce7726 family protein n=1 Tax=Neobacillus oceani TaxID=3115292 RepID=UPI0039063A1D
MNSSNNIILNRFFTRNIFMDLINGKENSLYNTCIKRFLDDDVSTINNDLLINKVYKYISKEYRNEYFFKNTLLNKLLLGRHSLNTTTALTEIPINKSKADFILINGKAVAYEIKTGLDNLDRLESQINDYYKAFNHVSVISCESNYEKLMEMFNDTKVGVSILTEKDTISIKKKPVEDNSSLDYSVMFKILRKNEFENIILSYYGYLPVTTQVAYYKECFKAFSKIDKGTVYKYFITELKKRTITENEEYKNVPYELKFLVYFSKFKKSDYSKLNRFLERQWRGQ